MRIGIDAHIILPKHKRYDPQIARYTENIIRHIVDAPEGKHHVWVLFFDERTPEEVTKKFEQLNVEIHKFPFVQYRQYLPVVYSHMLISSFLRSARLDVFHSPEGLIPFLYPGKIVTTFHHVPEGKAESSLFARTFMLGARAAFVKLCKKARRIIVSNPADKKRLVERHDYPAERVVVMETDDADRVDWPLRVKELLAIYEEVATEKKTTKPDKAASQKTTA